jgi:hypothetical protein
MKRILAIALFSAAMIAALSVRAEDKIADVTDMNALRTAVRTDKKAFVAATLKLTDAEAKRFWPIYDAYERDIDVVNRRRVLVYEGLIGRDKPLSNVYAKNLANELIAADEAEMKLRRTLHNRLIKPLAGRTVMPTAKAARYLQLESKIRAYQAYDIAVTFPLVK